MTLSITPETKVGALLEAYPAIEDSLIEWVPAFSKLKNPILRRTVAKVATLEQAARMGGIGVRDLVLRLRKATGQEGPAVNAAAEAGANGGRPVWVREDEIRHRIDADEMLAGGVHPVGKVRESCASLAEGELVLLSASFLPAPLIDTIARGGYATYHEQSEPGRFAIYFGKLATATGDRLRLDTTTGSPPRCPGSGC